MRYFMCSITEANGGNEYDSMFLMDCPPDIDPAERFDEIVRNFRGEGEQEGDDYVAVYPDGTVAIDTYMNETSTEEYQVLSKYLSTL